MPLSPPLSPSLTHGPYLSSSSSCRSHLCRADKQQPLPRPRRRAAAMDKQARIRATAATTVTLSRPSSYLSVPPTSQPLVRTKQAHLLSFRSYKASTCISSAIVEQTLWPIKRISDGVDLDLTDSVLFLDWGAGGAGRAPTCLGRLCRHARVSECEAVCAHHPHQVRSSTADTHQLKA